MAVVREYASAKPRFAANAGSERGTERAEPTEKATRIAATMSGERRPERSGATPWA